jgi:hypothetical protein
VTARRPAIRVSEKLERAVRATAILGIVPEIDRSRLVKRLRDGAEIGQREREFLADLIEGKTRRPPHRPKSTDAAIKADSIAQDYFYLEAMRPEKKEARIAQVMQWHGVGRRYVFRVLREIDPDRLANIKMAAAALSCTESRKCTKGPT